MTMESQSFKKRVLARLYCETRFISFLVYLYKGSLSLSSLKLACGVSLRHLQLNISSRGFLRSGFW